MKANYTNANPALKANVAVCAAVRVRPCSSAAVRAPLRRCVPAACLAAALLFSALASPARAEVGVGLAALPGDTVAGFARARLTVSDPNAELLGVVRAVALRTVPGGPTVLFDATVAPGARDQALDVLLPALSPQQVYQARLLAARDAPASLLVRELPIAWPIEVAAKSRQQLIDPAACARFQEDLPRWEPALLRKVFLAAVIAAALFAATLLFRGSALRLLAVLALAAALSYGAVRAAEHQPSLRQRTYDDLTVVAARRTSPVQLRGPLLPVYRNPDQFDSDTLTIRPGIDLHVEVAPDQPRVFRIVSKNVSGPP